MSKSLLAVKCDLHKRLWINTATFSEHFGDSISYIFILVVQVDENPLYRVIIEGVRPFNWQQFKEELKSFCGLNSYCVLCIIKSLKQLFIDSFEVVVF